MLSVKNNTKAILDVDASGTGQNVLYYNDSTSQVRYSTVNIPTIGVGSNNSVERTTTQVSSASFATYESTTTQPAGVYFVMVSYIYLSPGTTRVMECQILNNSDNSTFGNLGGIAVPSTNARCSAAACGISTLTSSSTFSFQFRNTSSGSLTVTMTGCRITCLRIG